MDTLSLWPCNEALFRSEFTSASTIAGGRLDSEMSWRRSARDVPEIEWATNQLAHCAQSASLASEVAIFLGIGSSGRGFPSKQFTTGLSDVSVEIPAARLISSRTSRTVASESPTSRASCWSHRGKRASARLPADGQSSC